MRTIQLCVASLLDKLRYASDYTSVSRTADASPLRSPLRLWPLGYVEVALPPTHPSSLHIPPFLLLSPSGSAPKAWHRDG